MGESADQPLHKLESKACCRSNKYLLTPTTELLTVFISIIFYSTYTLKIIMHVMGILTS